MPETQATTGPNFSIVQPLANKMIIVPPRNTLTAARDQGQPLSSPIDPAIPVAETSSPTLRPTQWPYRIAGPTLVIPATNVKLDITRIIHATILMSAPLNIANAVKISTLKRTLTTFYLRTTLSREQLRPRQAPLRKHSALYPSQRDVSASSFQLNALHVAVPHSPGAPLFFFATRQDLIGADLLQHDWQDGSGRSVRLV